MKSIFIAVVGLGMVLLSGCATVPPDTTRLQGTWKGQEVVNGQPAVSWLTLSGSDLEFHGSDPNEWYRGTYTLNEKVKPKQLVAVIATTPLTQYVGKTANAIYEFIPGPQ